jgi:hypothetical protein
MVDPVWFNHSIATSRPSLELGANAPAPRQFLERDDPIASRSPSRADWH